MSNCISIALVDDHLIFLDALENFLQKIDGFRIVYKATSGEDLVSYLKTMDSYDIDILLLDIKMKGMSGLDCLDFLTKEHPGIKVIMVSIFHDSLFINEAVNRGALSFIPKDIDSEVLV